MALNLNPSKRIERPFSSGKDAGSFVSELYVEARGIVFLQLGKSLDISSLFVSASDNQGVDGAEAFERKCRLQLLHYSFKFRCYRSCLLIRRKKQIHGQVRHSVGLEAARRVAGLCLQS